MTPQGPAGGNVRAVPLRRELLDDIARHRNRCDRCPPENSGPEPAPCAAPVGACAFSGPASPRRDASSSRGFFMRRRIGGFASLFFPASTAHLVLTGHVCYLLRPVGLTTRCAAWFLVPQLASSPHILAFPTWRATMPGPFHSTRKAPSGRNRSSAGIVQWE